MLFVRIEFTDTGEDFKERCFTGAVAADNSDLLAAADKKIKMRKHCLPSAGDSASFNFTKHIFVLKIHIHKLHRIYTRPVNAENHDCNHAGRDQKPLLDKRSRINAPAQRHPRMSLMPEIHSE